MILLRLIINMRKGSVKEKGLQEGVKGNAKGRKRRKPEIERECYGECGFYPGPVVCTALGGFQRSPPAYLLEPTTEKADFSLRSK
jgi:hypothetical protein